MRPRRSCLLPVVPVWKRLRTVLKEWFNNSELLLAGGWSLRFLGYEYNYSRLQTGGLPSHRLKEEIIYRFGFSSDILVQRVAGLEAAE